MKAAKQSSSKKKKKKKTDSSSSPSSYSDPSSSSTDSSSDSDDSLSDGRAMLRRRNRRKQSLKKTTTSIKVRKENQIQKLTKSMEEAQKGMHADAMLNMATELRELRGLPELIEKQFDEQQEKHNGKDEEKAEPLLTMSQ